MRIFKAWVGGWRGRPSECRRARPARRVPQALPRNFSRRPGNAAARPRGRGEPAAFSCRAAACSGSRARRSMRCISSARRWPPETASSWLAAEGLRTLRELLPAALQPHIEFTGDWEKAEFDAVLLSGQAGAARLARALAARSGPIVQIVCGAPEVPPVPAHQGEVCLHQHRRRWRQCQPDDHRQVAQPPGRNDCRSLPPYRGEPFRRIIPTAGIADRSWGVPAKAGTHLSAGSALFIHGFPLSRE